MKSRRPNVAADNLPRALSISLAIVVCAVFAALISATAPIRAGAVKTGAPSAALRIGEILTYRIDWRGHIGAGAAQLQVVDRSDFYGADCWHLRAILRTTAPIRMLYALDDQIDSYARLANFESREYQEHFREFGHAEDTLASFLSPGELSSAPPPHVIVPRGTREPLSAIYFLRFADWRELHTVHVPVFDGQDVCEMTATAEITEPVHVPAGDYAATRIVVRLLTRNQEIPEQRFTVWIANDPARTPVMCLADFGIGAVQIELTSDSASEANAGSRATPREDSNHRAGN